jgi:hypothetical protein
VRIAFPASLGAALLFASPSLRAQSVDVTYLNGLVTIQCKEAPLSNVFERIEQATGIELTLEDEVKSKRLSANLAGLPVSMAVSRLLEGVGVNYIVMMDPYDWERVAKIFVGAGGGGPARSAGPVREPVVTEEPEETFEDVPPESFEEGMEGMEFGDAADPGLEMPEGMENPDEFGVVEDPEAFAPPGSSPLPEFLPPAQSFPRSNFTPGLPQRNQRTQGAQSGQSGLNQPQQFEQQDPANTPPATYPFTDPFGRPIPIPPGMNQQQQQQQRRQQQQQQQQ